MWEKKETKEENVWRIYENEEKEMKKGRKS